MDTRTHNIHRELASKFLNGKEKLMVTTTAELLKKLIQLQHSNNSLTSFLDSTIVDVIEELQSRGYDHVRDELDAMGGCAGALATYH